MKNKARIVELIKDAVIVLLLISAVALGARSGYYSALTDRLRAAFGGEGGEAARPQQGYAVENSDLAVPEAVLVSRGGALFASVYSGAVREDFGAFSAYFTEALGSAGQPEEIGENVFRSRLEERSAAFGYDVPRGLGMLGLWLSTGMDSAAVGYETALAALCVTEGGVELCFSTPEGKFFRCETALAAEGLDARIDAFSGISARFAYSDGLYSGCSPYMAVPEEMPEISGVAAADPVAEGLDASAIMDALGMNSLVASSYSETDGTVVFIEGGSTVRIDPYGRLSYDAGGAARGASGDASGAVGLAENVMRSCLETVGGDAGAGLLGLEATESGWAVSFRYEVNGIAVESEWGPAARISVAGGEITGAEILLRRYSLTGETERVLPAEQAFAVASAQGRDPALIYADGGEGVSCVWVSD